jgi:UDPglucose 6-dehydrogenase
MKIVVYGLWHLGTVTSACLAEIGHSVTGFDESVNVINSLSNGALPVSEPGLDELVSKNLREGKLQFVSDLSQLPVEFDYLWVTIDTPVDDSDDAD